MTLKESIKRIELGALCIVYCGNGIGYYQGEEENGEKIDVRTSNEHGLPHAHISGNGPNTTIGLDKMPMKNHPSFSRKQLNVIQNNWETIKDGIIKFFPKK